MRTGRAFSLALPFGADGANENGVLGRSNAQLFVSMSGADIEASAQDRLFPGSGSKATNHIRIEPSHPAGAVGSICCARMSAVSTEFAMSYAYMKEATRQAPHQRKHDQ